MFIVVRPELWFVASDSLTRESPYETYIFFSVLLFERRSFFYLSSHYASYRSCWTSVYESGRPQIWRATTSSRPISGRCCPKKKITKIRNKTKRKREKEIGTSREFRPPDKRNPVDGIFFGGWILLLRLLLLLSLLLLLLMLLLFVRQPNGFTFFFRPPMFSQSNSLQTTTTTTTTISYDSSHALLFLVFFLIVFFF